MRNVRSGLAGLAIAGLLSTCAAPVRAASDSTSEAPVLGADLVLEGLDGQPLRLADHLGKRLLIVTWASW